MVAKRKKRNGRIVHFVNRGKNDLKSRKGIHISTKASLKTEIEFQGRALCISILSFFDN